MNKYEKLINYLKEQNNPTVLELIKNFEETEMISSIISVVKQRKNAGKVLKYAKTKKGLDEVINWVENQENYYHSASKCVVSSNTISTFSDNKITEFANAYDLKSEDVRNLYYGKFNLINPELPNLDTNFHYISEIKKEHVLQALRYLNA